MNGASSLAKRFNISDIADDGMITSIFLERYVLAVFYFATSGPNHWIDTFDFLSTESVCYWNNNVTRGVFCNEQGYVKDIYLGKFFQTRCPPNEDFGLCSICVSLITMGVFGCSQ